MQLLILKNMKPTIQRKLILAGWILPLCGGICLSFFPAMAENVLEKPTPSENTTLDAGIRAYREGHYPQAFQQFEPLHAQHPENTKLTYYLAITQARLGNFQEAKRYYEEVLALDPRGEAATLAKQGLNYLPIANTGLDLPPNFPGSAQPEPTPQGAGQATLSREALPSGNSLNGSSPNSLPGNMAANQDWLLWQQMMGGGAPQNSMGGYGAMMPMGMPFGNSSGSASMNGSNGMNAFDPSMMSNMMMNQMMQNFSLGGEKDDNR